MAWHGTNAFEAREWTRLDSTPVSCSSIIEGYWDDPSTDMEGGSGESGPFPAAPPAITIYTECKVKGMRASSRSGTG